MSKFYIAPDDMPKRESSPPTKMYHPEDDFSIPSTIAFFLVDDEWSKETLEKLKEQTGACYILGLKTSNKFIEADDVIESVISCEVEQVDRIVMQFQTVLFGSETCVSIDFGDVRRMLKHFKYVKYIESTLSYSAYSIEELKQQVQSLIAQMPRAKHSALIVFFIDNVFGNIRSVERLRYFCEPVESSMEDHNLSELLYMSTIRTDLVNYGYFSVIYPIEPTQSE